MDKGVMMSMHSPTMDLIHPEKAKPPRIVARIGGSSFWNNEWRISGQGGWFAGF